MLPLSDGLRPRRFPIVNVTLIAANFAVWIFYELPHLHAAIHHASFYPCTVANSCRGPEPWGLSWLTSMFMHGSWDHILGNMLFLAIFGKNVEDAYGHLRYLAFYIAGGFVATMTQCAVTLIFGTAAAARVPGLGASGAIAAVLGAFIVLYPTARIRTLVLVFFVRIPAWVYLGGWFLYQLPRLNLGERRGCGVLRPHRRLPLRRVRHGDAARSRTHRPAGHVARRGARSCLRRATQWRHACAGTRPRRERRQLPPCGAYRLVARDWRRRGNSR